jgi:type I restriction enzyme M protein
MVAYSYQKDIAPRIKELPEQQLVVGPLVEQLVKLGWTLDQMVFGKKEWRIPKSPSELTKREKNHSFLGFPVDIAVFDSAEHCGDPRHLLFIIECKVPTEKKGISQLESYFMGEPHAQLGVWANSSDLSAKGAFLYRHPDGRMLLKKSELSRLPRPGEAIKPDSQAICFGDLVEPSEAILTKIVSDLLDKVVSLDSVVTRREDQLDQLCNVLLTKLESDKQAKSDPSRPVIFRPLESSRKTATAIKAAFERLRDVYPETFVTQNDQQLRFADDTIAACTEALAGLRLCDMSVASVAVAFQVLRSEALKQGEGQYFTPQGVILSAVRLMKIEQSDIIIDPACGTGGFLVESMLEMKRRFPKMSEQDLSRWAQTHIFGIEKDAVGIKLTKAIMQIAGDGSAHCARGDSLRTYKWPTDFPHLGSGAFRNGRFSVVLTNPPFGKNLKVDGKDSRLSGLTIAAQPNGSYDDVEIGLLFLERAYQLLRKGGRLGIVLPESYFFSPTYAYVLDWIKPRLRPVLVANIPMEAFQGFCRAKTNFYIFEKIGSK